MRKLSYDELRQVHGGKGCGPVINCWMPGDPVCGTWPCEWVHASQGCADENGNLVVLNFSKIC